MLPTIGRTSGALYGATSESDYPGATFAVALASAREHGLPPSFGGSEAWAMGSSGSTLSALARQLDAVARHRVEAQARSEDIGAAWAARPDLPTLAANMHRQARAMASYNMSVMWSAKLVGVTAGALRQLATAA
ncbi:hypothetical protein [Trinickia soli]|uniref:Uncharacterized protein n=1 Tax=Trinickia soli TaxID=380675 RepID=A0A2N7VXI8_9BURK|nr:hypothetical protein [Trinickia soli]KAA0090450.1 hypothetical protein CIW54_03495 [Paraburkholderia sp. T12-10]PMS21867.1 hypothetical protein C0Z19_18035 [Trinickia soli]CAB3649749.1 hypothetical protein LMG24076_00877 [Trinickia soli]